MQQQPPMMQAPQQNMQGGPPAPKKHLKPVIILSRFTQISAIVSKEFILWSRSYKSLIVKYILLFILAYIYSSFSALSCYIPLLVGICLSIMEPKAFVEQMANEKELNFKSTFKLMGLSETAYFIGNFAFRLCTSMIMLGVFLLASAVTYNGQFGIMMDFKYFGAFLLGFYLLLLANLAYFQCLSEFIPNPKDVKHIIPLIMAILFLYPIVWIAIGGSWETSVLEYILLGASPMGAYFLFVKELFVKNAGFNSTTFIYLGVLFLEFVVYSILYFILSGYIGFSSGVSRKLFRSKGKSIATSDIEGPLNPNQAVMSIMNLKKRFGSFYALDDISMDINSNVITCILGHNGAGKSTLINTIVGILSPTEGSVTLRGEDVYSSPDVLSGRVGYCTSHDVLYEDMTVSEFMIFIAYIKGIQDPLRYVNELIERCELRPYSDQFTKNLSGGTRRRTSIACAALGEPEVIFMDEPSSGVDPENRRQIWKLIEGLKSPTRAVILTTHHLEEAEYLSEDVVIMDKGQIEIRGNPQHIMANFGVGYTLNVENQASRQQAE